MFERTWEEVLERFSALAEARKGDFVGNIAEGMRQIIPKLQTGIAVANLDSVQVITAMLSIELIVPTKRYQVCVYSESPALYYVYIKKDWKTIQEESVAFENVVPLVVKYLCQIRDDNFEA